MRLAHMLVITIILASSASTEAITTRGIITCSNASIDSLPGDWSISDQSCLRVDLGEREPGSIIFFEISSDNQIDILLFPAANIEVYQSESSYRSESVWISESVFEAFSGSGEWHWEVPTDRAKTRWYLVIDNLAHPQDSGQGSQGGFDAEISLNGGEIISDQFTLSDSIHRVDPDDYSIVHGPFYVDEGTFVNIYARTMEGDPDIFVMTETALSYYSPSTNWSSSLRIASADMLFVNDQRYFPWMVNDDYDDPLYIIVDNRLGPGGGGAGTQDAAVTVTVTLTPILDPKISSETDLDTVNVGQVVTFSSLETPNRSQQFSMNSFTWDMNGDGNPEGSEQTIDYTWNEPGSFLVTLNGISTDSRGADSSRTITVSDLTAPEISMETSTEITKGFGDTLEIRASFSDNWGVSRLDWMLDGEIIESNYEVFEPNSTLVLAISNDFSAGQHVVSLVVTDKSDQSSQKDVLVNFIDVTAPEIEVLGSPIIETVVGERIFLQNFALDNESEDLEYTWIIDQGSENEIQLLDSGPQVFYEFQSKGTKNVLLIVENDAGLTSYLEILVIVSEDEDDSGLGMIAIGGIIVLLITIISIVSFMAYNSAVGRKMSDFEETQDEAESELTPPPPSSEMQKQMWGSDSGYSPFQSSFQDEPIPPADPDLFDMLGVEKPQTEPEKVDELEQNLLGDLQDTPRPDDSFDDRTLRKSCENCSMEFQISLPEGVEEAYTNCPYCGHEQRISLN